MKEYCCQFGGGALAGIVSEPTNATRGRVVVLVSAGVTPKFGPFRLYAELARRLASEGFRTLRFDLGGIGDSSSAHAQRPVEQRTRLELQAALDYLDEHFAVDGVVLAGLCSGAEDAFRHAEYDARVKHLVLIDPFAYKTVGFAWRHLRDRARGRALRALGIVRPLPRDTTSRLVDYEYMTTAAATSVLQKLLARNVRLDFIYTGGMSRKFNHPGQLKAMFRGMNFRGLVKVEHFPRLDHTQLLEADRRTLVDAIARQLRE